MERTCVIVKPDGVGKRVIGQVISRLEAAGLKLLGMRLCRPAPSMMEEFYGVHRGKPFFGPFMRFVTSGPVVVTAWEGENAVAAVRALIGATNSKEAAPGTLRNQFGTDNRRNLVHASDSVENGQREIAFFFSDGDLVSYDHADWERA